MVCPVAKLTPVAEKPICQGTAKSLPLVGRVTEDPKMNDMVSGKPNSMGAPLIHTLAGSRKSVAPPPNTDPGGDPPSPKKSNGVPPPKTSWCPFMYPINPKLSPLPLFGIRKIWFANEV